MREYNMDIIVQQTYNVTVSAASEEEAEAKARALWDMRQTDFIDEGIIDVDIVEDFVIDD